MQTRNDKTALRLAVAKECLDGACCGSHGGIAVCGIVIVGVWWWWGAFEAASCCCGGAATKTTATTYRITRPAEGFCIYR